MPTNVFFDNFGYQNEQRVLEDLVVESIKIYGLDCYYLVRDDINIDPLLTEDAQPSYTSAYLAEMYCETINGFLGQGDFYSKFNLFIDDDLELSLARRIFAENVGDPAGLIRPREADLVWFPLNNKIFKINFVEHEPTFYQLGAQYFYKLKLKLFEYSNEVFQTGIPQIDALTKPYDFNLVNEGIEDEDEFQLVDDNGIPIMDAEFDKRVQEALLGDQSNAFQHSANVIIDWTEEDPFAEGKY